MNVQSPRNAAAFSEVFEAGTLTFSLSGEVDHHNAKGLREGMDAAIISIRAKRVVIDLSGVDFMDSAGLGLILGRFTRTRDMGGTLSVTGASPRTARILHMAGVDKIISITQIGGSI